MNTLPHSATALRQALEGEDYAGARQALNRLVEDVQGRVASLVAGSPEAQALEHELRELLSWARTAARVSRSHLAHRWQHCRAASRYASPLGPAQHTTLRMDA
ncbi:MAG: hypothetical protein FJW34_12510 [Acidobacteria bacterium]|nr:hypothetical protein [Acidobacteriota bacterium]